MTTINLPAKPPKDEDIFNSSEFFIFPNDNEGILVVHSKFQLMQLLEEKFMKQYGPSSYIKWDFYNCGLQLKGNLEVSEIQTRCKQCTNSLIYRKHLSFDSYFKLIKMNRYHIHSTNTEKIREINMKMRDKKLFSSNKYQTSREKLYRVMNQYSS